MIQERVNIAELLKDCPKGMELDCINYTGVIIFEGIYEGSKYPIKISVKYDNEHFIHTLTKYGQTCISPYNKCVIFPKGKTTWKGFVPPNKFKEGDVVISTYGDIHLLRTEDSSYCAYRYKRNKLDKTITANITVFRLATKDEKQKLFQVIKDNGYEWCDETKILVKLIEPKFKVGDTVRNKSNHNVTFTITSIE